MSHAVLLLKFVLFSFVEVIPMAWCFYHLVSFVDLTIQWKLVGK